MRLIDADVLPTDDFLNNTKMVLQTDIDNAPTIDAVPVVRCKDCKHYSDNLNDISGVCHYEIMARIRGPEDYCSKGVRKDNKKDI